MTTCQRGGFHRKNKTQELEYNGFHLCPGSENKKGLSELKSSVFCFHWASGTHISASCVSGYYVRDGMLIGWKSKQELLTFSKKLLRRWCSTKENDNRLLVNAGMSSIFLREEPGGSAALPRERVCVCVSECGRLLADSSGGEVIPLTSVILDGCQIIIWALFLLTFMNEYKCLYIKAVVLWIHFVE